MSDYSQITFFTPKDSLATGNPNKIIYGSDVDAELSAISTAIATKADVDGDAIGAGTPATELSVDNLKLDANKIISTNTDGDIELEPNGAGYVVITNVDVNAGNIDNTVIGATTAAAITGTTLTANTSLALATGATVTAILDEDAMTSNSATALATQQSIKAYVDAQVTAQDLDVTTDSGTIAIDLDSETLTVAGGTGLDTSATGNTVTIAIDSTVATLTGAQTLTNKVLTSPDINTPDIDGGNIDGTVIGAATPAAGSFTTGSFSGNVTFADNAKAIFGAGSDLQIYHSGTHSYIQDSGTGSLRLVGADIEFLNEDFSDFFAKFANNGAATFYYDGSAKLATTATGIDVTGTVTADGLTVDGTASNMPKVLFENQANDGDAALSTYTDASGTALMIGSNGYFNSSAVASRFDATKATAYTIYNRAGFIQNYTNDSSGASVERLRINPNGDISFYEDTGTTPKFFWDASAESLGIGTTSPAASLHVVSGATTTALIQSSAVATTLAINNTHANAWGSNLAIRTGGVDSGYFGTIGSLLGSTSQDLTVYATAGNGFRVYTNGNNERMRIDSSGNVGIGVAPSTWGSGTNTALQIRSSGFVQQDSSTNVGLGRNAYQSGTWSYIADGYAQMLNLESDGAFKFFQAGSGTAGNPITFTQAMTLDQSGNLLVGRTTSDGYRVALAGSSQATSGLQMTYDSVQAGTITITSNSAMAFGLDGADGSTERMRIDSSGNVGIGTSSPAAKLSVQGDGLTVRLDGTANTSRGIFVRNTGASGEGIFQTDGNMHFLQEDASRYMRFSTANAEAMRIDSSGNLLVGTTSTGLDLSTNASGLIYEPSNFLCIATTVGGNSNIILNKTNSSAGTCVDIRYNGNIVGTIQNTASSTSYNTSSDYRLKDVDGPITNSGAYIDALKPVQGSWKADGSRFIGLIAHEVQEVSETPIATGEKDGEEMQGMDYSAPELIANLIAEIQSLRARVAQLEGA